MAFFCRYKSFYYSADLRFDGWKLIARLPYTVSTHQNANWPNNKKLCSDRRRPFRDAQQLDGYENPLGNSMVTKDATSN